MAHEQLTLNRTTENIQKWRQAKSTFDLWAEQHEAAKTSYSQLHFHRFGNKAGRLLAKMCSGPRRPTRISALRAKTGSLVTSPAEISNLLVEYYTNLYKADPTDLPTTDLLLNKIRLPKLHHTQLETINAPITVDDIRFMIKNMASAKAPGPDGYTAEFYKMTRDFIPDTLKHVYAAMWDGGPYLPTGTQAHIKLISKKGKDPLLPGSYRPISLINVDVKILSKIIASRLAPLLPSLLHPAQSGFVSGRSATLNIRKVLMALEYAKTHPNQDIAIMSLDAEKAFDNISFSWLFRVMTQFGFSGPIMRFLLQMYASPTARLVTPDFISDTIPLTKGTRQGCPLSPLLFNLAIEPLSRILNSADGISGITLENHTLRSALFADDILLFSTDPITDFDRLKQLFSDFRLCSGFRINFDKSEILPLHPHLSSKWKHLSPLAIANQHITYLGIKIGREPSSLYSLNYPPLITKIVKELEAWGSLPLSLFGRCHLFKMVSFARLLYPMQTIPLLIKHSDIQKLQKALTAFIWSRKKPRIALQKLCLPKGEGGAGLPNMRFYNLACLLRQGLDWLTGGSKYSNLSLEEAMVHPYDLSAILHSNPNTLPPHLKTSVIIKDTVIAWRETRKLLKVPSSISKYLKIQGNPMFLPSIIHKAFGQWKLKGLTDVSSLYLNKPGKFKPFQTLMREYSLSPTHVFFYHQLISYLKSCSGPSTNPLETSCIDTLIKSNNYSISNIYSCLIQHQTRKYALKPFQKWSHLLDDESLPEKILEGYKTVRNLTASESWSETQFKIIHRAYFPFRFNKKDPTQAQCSWCNLPRPTLLHRLWDCNKIDAYWTKVITYINEVHKIQCTKDRLLCLFSIPPSSSSLTTVPQNIPHWAHLCLLVARRTIMSHWISATPPTLTMFKKALASLFHLERLDTITLNLRSTSRFFKRWRKYIEATFASQALIEIMNPFRYTKWYLTKDLTNSLGRLKIPPTPDSFTFNPP